MSVRNSSFSSSASVALWLYIMAALVFAMAIIGAITRLTDSGLSIMEWAPISGSLPPLSEAEWLRLFELYQGTDEFRLDNPDMDLAGFKQIFWWEWIHRQWGRMMGIAFAVPLIVVWVRGRLAGWLKPWLIFALALGGFQAFLGWFMVHSGFQEGLTDVSHFRLALHLGAAAILFALLLVLALRLSDPNPRSYVSRSQRLGLWAFALALTVLIITGAFVAGMNAGLVYNEWPTMGDGLFPFDYREEGTGWLYSALNYQVALQFNHRWLAALVAIGGIALGLSIALRGQGRARLAGALLAFGCVGQFCLGLLVLLLGVPVWAGAVHQGGALTLVAITVYAFHNAHVAD